MGLVNLQLKLEMITATNIDLFHSRQFDLSGVTNDINDGSVPFRCSVSPESEPTCTMARPWHWSS